MEYSIFLARTLGIFLGLIYLAFLVRPNLIKSIGKEVEKASAVYYVAAIFTLLFGTILVVSHNVWILGWPVIVTLVAWLIFITAIIRLFFPDLTRKLFDWWIGNVTYFRVATIVGLIISLYLLYCGFVM